MTNYIIIILLLSANCSLADNKFEFVTQTVYGFLDFTTTIGSTVMVFSPQSAPLIDLEGTPHLSANVIKTKPILKIESITENNIKPTITPVFTISFISNAIEQDISKVMVNNSAINCKSNMIINNAKDMNSINFESVKELVLPIENILYEPEYNLLSRQPAEYAEETYRVMNLGTSDEKRVSTIYKKLHKSIGSESNIERKQLGGELREEISTIDKASVIESYAFEKHTIVPPISTNIYRNLKSKIRPTTLKVLKTAAPTLIKSTQSIKTSTRSPPLSNRIGSRSSTCSTCNDSVIIPELKGMTENKKLKHTNRTKSKRRNKSSKHSIKEHSSYSNSVNLESNNRRFRSKIVQPSMGSNTSTSLYMFKLNRTPGRWLYKTSPKPRIIIRKHKNSSAMSHVTINSTTSTTILLPDEITSNNQNQNSILWGLDSSASQQSTVSKNINVNDHPKVFIETINVEISTPMNFKERYFEIVTLKTPLKIQAGALMKTRYITVTSTFEKMFIPEATSSAEVGPLTENIISPSKEANNFLLDGSVITLMPIYLSDDAETPNLEIITESLSSTQVKLKTQILPILRRNTNETKYITLVQTYDFTNFITVTKTVSQFFPLKKFKDFGGNLEEAGSEINLELEFGDEDNENINHDKLLKGPSNVVQIAFNNTRFLQPLTDNKPSFNQQQMKQYGIINAFNPSNDELKTLWETHLVPIVNGLSTRFRTLSKSIGAVNKTEFQLDSISSSLIYSPPSISANPFLLPLHQHFHTLTSAVVHHTTTIKTNSKTLKLTFGAKTAYTTIYSTELVPTVVTMFITTSLAVQQTNTFPGYYPQPYPQFAYVGK